MSIKDVGDGAIAGIVTGVIMGILAILLTLLGLVSAVPFVDVRSVFGGLLPLAGLTAASITAMIALLLFMAVLGLIMGAVFGAVYESVPAAGPVAKGIIFMLAIWAVFGLLLPILMSVSHALPVALSAWGIVTALVAAFIWGGLLGVFFRWVAAASARPVVRTP